MAFADPLADVVGYLGVMVDPIQVTTRVPPDATPRPPLVQVRRVGGAADVPVREDVRLDVLVWHHSEAEAMALALTVRAAMWALGGGVDLGYPCYRVEEFLSPRQSDDDLTGIPRVWATYSLTIRANDLVAPNPSAF